MAYKILIVDDDVLLRRSLAFNFEKCGYPANTAENAEDALAIINIDPPDLILLDIGLPGMDGLDAISEIRNSKNIPVIFLTARRSGSDQVTGLNAGADDYITKPFDFDVLLAHVKAVLRRRENPVQEPEENILQVGDLKLDFPQHKAEIGGKELELSPKEFELLGVIPQRIRVINRFGAECRSYYRHGQFTETSLGGGIYRRPPSSLCPYSLAAQ